MPHAPAAPESEFDFSELDALPQPPALEGQVMQLCMSAALCADQIELALKQAKRLNTQSQLAQQQRARKIHHESFCGCVTLPHDSDAI